MNEAQCSGSEKRIVFITGTRADYGKLKSIIEKVNNTSGFEGHIFVTGMHMLRKYGYTMNEIEKGNYRNVHTFINQNHSDTMDSILGKTISGLSDYVKEIKPDMIVIHGDRVESMAGSIVGSLNNILVSHIEGGEVSGTIDDVLRHATTKLSHLHFVSNDHAKKRLRQLGENKNHIHVIGSPDVDIIQDGSLPEIGEVKSYYNIVFEHYAIFLFHSVTTEVNELKEHVKGFVDAMISSNENYIGIFPNNDNGNDLIIAEYERLKSNSRFLVFPSIRFEFFLTLLKNAKFIIGNSSCALMEAPYFGVPAIDIGSRQSNRAKLKNVVNVEPNRERIEETIFKIQEYRQAPIQPYGAGNSALRFLDVIKDSRTWEMSRQKVFQDRH
jgi:UDP-N-acetylglucosamine 2-epimerase (hydrolysing)